MNSGADNGPVTMTTMTSKFEGSAALAVVATAVPVVMVTATLSLPLERTVANNGLMTHQNKTVRVHALHERWAAAFYGREGDPDVPNGWYVNRDAELQGPPDA